MDVNKMAKASETLIQLNDNLFYGKGTHKKCYLYPDKKDLCIKIAYNRGGQKDLLREINYISVLRRRNKDYSLLPQYYGEVNTNLGKGYVFEIIKDYDGNKCQTLEDFITSPELFADKFTMIASLLKQLKDELYKNEIITMVLFPENIIFQKTSENKYRLRIINDMGSSVLIPLEYHFTYFAHTKILRRWTKFLDVLKNNYQSPLINKLIEEIK